MKLDIKPDWLLRMAEKEGNGIVSVGGLVNQVDDKPASIEALTKEQKEALEEFVKNLAQ